jgi:hypothetical protein
MRREQLEHLIRASASITNEYETVVVGSQSILGAYPDAPEILLESMEADLYPLNRPDLADVIDGPASLPPSASTGTSRIASTVHGPRLRRRPDAHSYPPCRSLPRRLFTRFPGIRRP